MRNGGLQNTHQFIIEATSIAIGLIVKAAAPQRSVGGTTVRALCLDTSGSGVGSGLVTGETCAVNVGGTSILCLDNQGRPLVRLGVDNGEGRELVHGRSERSKRSHLQEGGWGGRSISLLRLVGLRVNVFGLEILMETGCRRPGARGFDCCKEFIKGQLDRWVDDVEMIGIVQCQTFSKVDGICVGRGRMVQGASFVGDGW